MDAELLRGLVAELRAIAEHPHALSPDAKAKRIAGIADRIELSVAQGQGFVMVPMPAPNCRERLRVEGKPYPRSSCAVCGKFSPNSSRCDALLAGIAAAAPAQPDGVE